MNRFDYIEYDYTAIIQQKHFKEKFMDLEMKVADNLVSPRAKMLALTKLEEAYMWVGKAIRDDQQKRTGHVPLQEERTDS